MSTYVIDPPAVTAVPVAGGGSFPVRRIFCVGRNYAEHTREMGGEPERETPFFFTKPADAVVESGSRIPYPSATQNLHHEGELVVAIGKSGAMVSEEAAQAMIWGHAAGNDLTRRDLQAAAKAKGLPWDTAKGFDHSAPVGELVPAAQAGSLEPRLLELKVNGELRQRAPLSDLIWNVPEILHELSKLYALRAGDLVFMGTPAGVAALQPGDTFDARLGDIARFQGHIVQAAV